MAKSARKTSKSAPPVPSPVASAVAACFGVIYSALTDSAAQSAENAKRRESRSASCVNAIRTLREAIPDSAAFQSACIELFGNGEKKRDVRVAGTLADKMKADGITDVTAKSLLHHCRVVAVNWDAPAVQKAATESGIRAGYDATKTPKTEAVNPKGEPAPAKIVTLPELIAEMVGQLNGPSTVLGMIESALLSRKDTIRAAIVHDARVKLAA